MSQLSHIYTYLYKFVFHTIYYGIQIQRLTHTQIAYFELLGVKLLLSVCEDDGPVSVGVKLLDGAVGKHALLLAVWVDVLDRLVRERDLLGAVRVVLLTLAAGGGGGGGMRHSQ